MDRAKETSPPGWHISVTVPVKGGEYGCGRRFRVGGGGFEW